MHVVFVEPAFPNNQREFLRGLLSTVAPGLDKSTAALQLSELGVNEQARAEELDVATHVALSNRLGTMVRAQPDV